MMKKTRLFLAVCIAFLAGLSFTIAQNTPSYATYPNDPLKVRIYKLDNGLTVFMTVYKDAPRIQTAIAVKTGSKNDPHDNTGLSHYLEHLMFKGTEHFGTTGYAAEKVFLDKIDSLFEVYRSTTDTVSRKAIYHVIDSVSGIASKYAIASEYDKMLSVIGAKGTNAFTSVEQTVYINDIPSNQLETWLKIEAERFRDPVFRLFHTELETVYEEKNMSLDSDQDKVWETLYASLFQKHSYGTQTTIGTIEHLKNPSIITIRKYYHDRYVPSNMAIILSGDFDPDKAIALINENWGSLSGGKASPFTPAVEDPIDKPVVKEVIGPDAESVTIGFRLPGASSREADLVTVMNMILNNSTAGLIDLNLNQAQKVLEAYSYPDIMKDYTAHVFSGKPKAGQSLEEVKELVLSQIGAVKKGEFPDWLIPAVINDLKLSEIKKSESNQSRAFSIMNAFTQDLSWKDEVDRMDRLSKITKQDITGFANKYYGDNYVAVYKRTGTDPDVKKVSKPQISPVEMNRESESDFCKSVISRKAEPIEPVFVDFEKDIKKFTLSNGLEVLYKANTETGTFSLYYYFEMGTNHDKKIGIALDYLKYLGTSKLTPAQVQEEFYKNGCSFDVGSSEDQVWVMLSGLSENLVKGMDLFENLLADARPNPPALDNLVKDILKRRADDKLSKETILWSAMFNYGQFGARSPFTNILGEPELKQLKPEELVSILHGLTSFQHKVLFYGPQNEAELTKILDHGIRLPGKLRPVPAQTVFTELDNPKNQVYVVDYDMKQAEIIMLSKSVPYDKAIVPSIRVFNEYFGGGMNSIVWQEIRESKGLAYSAYGGFMSPRRPDRDNFVFAYIGTQVDKLPEAMKTMFGMINHMPESQKSFDASREAILKKIRTERITKANVIFNYLSAMRLGLNYDIRKDVYARTPSMTFADLKGFQEKYMKDKNYNILVLGKKNEMDLNTLEKYGQVTFLKLEDIFGY